MNKIRNQEPPNAVQIELVEGCNLACSYCGIQGIRDNSAHGPDAKRGKNSKPLKLMKVRTVNVLAMQLHFLVTDTKWNPRIEFAMHGEPTLYRELTDVIDHFRQALPHSHMMLTTNGGGLMRSTQATINNILNAGINVLLVDNYDGAKMAKKIRKNYKGPHAVYEYPADKSANPHRRSKPHEHKIVIAADPANATGGTHRYVNNHCGCAFPPNDSMVGKRCAKPFREVSIRWDGNVALCCNDWRGYYKCGNILDDALEEIWNNDYFKAGRQKLYHGERDFGPCYGCDTPSYRVGLLPDKLGKASMPKPNQRTYELICAALKGKPYTKPIKRPWERSVRPHVPRRFAA